MRISLHLLITVLIFCAANAFAQSPTTSPAASPTTQASDEPAAPKRVSLTGNLPGELKVKKSRTGHLLVAAQIDGQDAGWFIFDTGAGLSCVDKKLAERLKLPEAGDVSALGTGGEQRTRLRHVKSLSFGPVLIEDAPVVDLDFSAISLAIGEQIDGVIGYECFFAGVFEVDLQNAKITAHDPATFALPEKQEWNTLRFAGRRPCLPGKIEDHEMGEFLVDLGANTSLTVRAAMVEKLKLLEGRETRGSMSGGVGGMNAARAGKVSSVTICGQRVDDVPTVFLQKDNKSVSEEDLFGSVGVGLLKHFRCFFDYKNQRVALVPLK